MTNMFPSFPLPRRTRYNVTRYLIVPNDEERRFHVFVAMPSDPACKAVRLVTTLHRAGHMLAETTTCGEALLLFVDVGPLLKEMKENEGQDASPDDEMEAAAPVGEAAKETKASSASEGRKDRRKSATGGKPGAVTPSSVPPVNLSNPIELSIRLLDPVPSLADAAEEAAAEQPAAKGSSGTKKGGGRNKSGSARPKKGTEVTAGLRVFLFAEVSFEEKMWCLFPLSEEGAEPRKVSASCVLTLLLASLSFLETPGYCRGHAASR
jgi:hypothetical protein